MLDRTDKFRANTHPLFAYHRTFMYKFMNTWNSMPQEKRAQLRELNDLKRIKNKLKSSRRIAYIPNTHKTYEWISLADNAQKSS